MMKFKEVDLSKNIYTLFVVIGMTAFIFMILVTQDIGTVNINYSVQIPLVHYTLSIWGTLGKAAFIYPAIAMLICALYSMVSKHKRRVCMVTTALAILLIAILFLFVHNYAIAGSTPGALLVVLIVLGLFSYGDTLF